MSEKERVKFVAIALHNGHVFMLPEPYRHADVALTIPKSDGVQVQGFFTSAGRFVTREEAYPIAHAAGQLLFREGTTTVPGVLYSEDLW